MFSWDMEKLARIIKVAKSIQNDVDSILAVEQELPTDEMNDREWEDALAHAYEPEPDPKAVKEELEDMGN